METATLTTPPSTTDAIHATWMPWVGRVLSALPILGLTMSAGMKFAQPPQVVEMFTGKFGYHQEALVMLGVIELLCVVLYLIPQTAVLGAVVMTGYLGGAVATHVRVSDAFVIPLLLGVLAWGGLYFRDERVRNLLPLRKQS
jgi:DoxX-like family